MNAVTRPLLEIEDLKISFPTPTGLFHAVRGVSFSVGRERLGIVGESGSGKSLTGRAIMQLLPANAHLSAKRLAFDGIDLLGASARTLRSLRGARLSLVMQDPKYSLNPVMTVGAQIAEAARIHGGVSKAEARLKALAMLDAVRIREPERVYQLYPHEVSGGMGQRIMIAMMLVPEPDLLIADEPTSALDVTVQLQVLSILDDLVRQRGMGLIFISHDLELVASFCDRVIVMYAGRMMEELPAHDLPAARHPYTRGLLNSLPRLGDQQAELATLTRDPAWLVEP
jgi:peptide/nickel transport system ATP-binding protein